MDYKELTDYSGLEYDPCPDFDSLLKCEPTELNKVLSCCERTRLHHSLRYGLIEETVQLLDRGAEVNIKDKSGRTALHIAVVDKSISPYVVNIITEKCLDINGKDKMGRTALHLAISCTNYEAVKVLLQVRADVDAQDCAGNSPLHYASYHCLDLVKTLVKHGANMELKNNKGTTPLHIIVSTAKAAKIQRKCLKTMKILIDKGANIDVQRSDGKTPLHVAGSHYYKGMFKVWRFLFKNGSKVHLQDKEGTTPLHLATKYNFQNLNEILKTESGKIATKVPDNEGKYPLHIATELRNLKIMKLLLDNGASVESRNKHHETALHLVTASKFIDKLIVILLIDRGAPTNVQDVNGMTPLHNAVKTLSTEIIQLLLENGAEVNIKNKDGGTPLHIATGRDSLLLSYRMNHSLGITYRTLLANGADPNVQDNTGNTALHNAVEHHILDTLQVFLERGADANIRNKNEETPLHIATSQTTKPIFCQIRCIDDSWGVICTALLANGASPNVKDNNGMTPLHNAVKINRLELVNLLIENGAEVNSTNEIGETPLHTLTRHSYNFYNSSEVTCTALLANGASPNVKDNNGMTPLHNAVKINRLDSVELLFENGADVNSKNEKGETPLHTLTRHGYGLYHSSVVTCTALLANGATPNLKDNRGMTPLHYAVEKCNTNIVHLLLDNGAEVNSKNGKGKTPLHIITLQRHCSLETFKLLLERGARVNEQDKYGRTALHNVSICVNKFHANKNKNLKTNRVFLRDASSIVLKLLEWGASQKLKDNFGKTASDYNCFTHTQKKYNIKMACINLKRNGSLYILNSSLQKLIKYCFEEIERMKLILFGNHSLYDIFHHSSDPKLLSNLELESAVLSIDLEANFPECGPLLRSTYRSSRERVQLLDSIPDKLQLPLPFEVTRYILTFVDNHSLRNVIRAKEEFCIEGESDATSESENESDWERNLTLDYNSNDDEYEEYLLNQAYEDFNFNYF